MKNALSRVLMITALLISWALLGMNVLSSQDSRDQPLLQSSALPTSPDETQGGLLSAIFSQETTERPSPCDRIKEPQILVYDDKIVLNIADAQWATFTDTNSMDPVIDAGANAIEYVPESESEICVGDIVSYRSHYADGVIIHRVVDIGYDDMGWYAIMKGDNLSYSDPGKIRFDQVQRVVIGILY
jgi:hypothetical protein